MDEEKPNQTNSVPHKVTDAAMNELPAESRNSDPQDDQNPELNTTEEGEMLPRLPLGSGPTKGRQLVRKEESAPKVVLTEAQRLLLLDTWGQSQLPATDFANLVGISKHSLYAWKKRFDEEGPAGLSDHPRGVRKGSQLAEVTRRTILMLKEDKPEWGCQRISDALARGPGLGASAGAVARVLHEAGYELEEIENLRGTDHNKRLRDLKIAFMKRHKIGLGCNYDNLFLSLRNFPSMGSDESKHPESRQIR